MIQDIAPHRYDNAFSHRRNPEPEDYVFYFEGAQVLAKEDPLTFPSVEEVLESGGADAESLIYLFLIDDKAFYLVKELNPAKLNGYHMCANSLFRTAEPQWLAYAGITGSQLYRWMEDHRFCGHCGTPMRQSTTERAFCCDNCGATVYPKISPAVIVAVTNGDKLLLTRYAGRPFKRYALIAGFTEIGETIEETVQREVMEEVGLKVKNIRYFKCQPWSFSDSLLMGFYCDLDGDDTITLDESELGEGTWFRREEIPEPESLMSLTSTMIQEFRCGRQ